MVVWISHDARVASVYRGCGRIAVDDRTDRRYQVRPSPIDSTPVDRAKLGTWFGAQFPETPIAVPRKSLSVSFSVRKPQEVRISLAERALSYRMVANLNRRALGRGCDGSG